MLLSLVAYGYRTCFMLYVYIWDLAVSLISLKCVSFTPKKPSFWLVWICLHPQLKAKCNIYVYVLLILNKLYTSYAQYEFNVLFQKIFIPTPGKSFQRKFLAGGGSQKAKILQESIELNWNFRRGGRLKPKSLLCGGPSVLIRFIIKKIVMVLIALLCYIACGKQTTSA